MSGPIIMPNGKVSVDADGKPKIMTVEEWIACCCIPCDCCNGEAPGELMVDLTVPSGTCQCFTGSYTVPRANGCTILGSLCYADYVDEFVVGGCTVEIRVEVWKSANPVLIYGATAYRRSLFVRACHVPCTGYSGHVDWYVGDLETNPYDCGTFDSISVPFLGSYNSCSGVTSPGCSVSA